MKRRIEQHIDLVDESVCTWYHLPEDMINLILHYLIQESPSLYFIPLMLVNKQSMSLLSRIKIDWLSIIENLKRSFPTSYRPDTPHPNSCADVSPVCIGLMRSICYYHNRLPVIRKEIDDYIVANNIIYKSKKGNPYKGFVGVKKLAQLVGQPYAFYKIVKKHRAAEIARKKHALRLKIMFDRTKWDNHFRRPIQPIK